jgi:hypothetical protein
LWWLLCWNILPFIHSSCLADIFLKGHPLFVLEQPLLAFVAAVVLEPPLLAFVEAAVQVLQVEQIIIFLCCTNGSLIHHM